MKNVKNTSTSYFLFEALKNSKVKDPQLQKIPREFYLMWSLMEYIF